MKQIIDQLLQQGRLSERYHTMASVLLESGEARAAQWVEDFLVSVYNIKIRKAYEL